MGGADIQVPGGVDRGDIDFVLRFLRLAWPNGILDDGTGTPAPLRALATHNLGHEEYFVYETPDAFALWSKEGFTDEASSSLVYLTVEDDALCFVVDALSSTAGSIVEQLVDALVENRRAQTRMWRAAS